MPNPVRYNETHQNRRAPPTSNEDLLGDALERAYGKGIDDLEGLVNHLNQGGPSGPNGQTWTIDNLQQELKRLSA